MPWLQLLINCSAENAEQFSEQLTNFGAVAVTYQDAADQEIFEPAVGTTPLWSTTRLTGLFEADADLNYVIESLKQNTDIDHNKHYRIEQLEDKDWIRTWMDDFTAIQFSESLWLCPSWLEPPDKHATNIMLDPGLAFGTGTHATTAMCMKWLASHIIPTTVIDYGCGSGILAVTAARLGATIIFAIDNDPQALLATQQNAEKNNVAPIIHTFLPQQQPNQPAMLLLANILAQPIIELAARFNELLDHNGQLVLSGILTTQANTVIQAYAPYIRLNVQNCEHDWVCLTGIKA